MIPTFTGIRNAFYIGAFAFLAVSCQGSLSSNSSGEQATHELSKEISAPVKSVERSEVLSALASSPVVYDNMLEDPNLAPLFSSLNTQTATTPATSFRLTQLPNQCNSQADITQYIQAQSERSSNDFDSSCQGEHFFLTRAGYGPLGCNLNTPYTAVGDANSRNLLSERSNGGITLGFLGDLSRVVGVVTGDNYFVGRAVVPGNSGQCTMSTIRGLFVQGTQQQINSQIDTFFDLTLTQQFDRIFDELLGNGDTDGDDVADVNSTDSTQLPNQCNSQADITQYIQTQSQRSNNDFDSSCKGEHYFLSRDGYGPLGCNLNTPYTAVGDANSRSLLSERSNGGITLGFLGDLSRVVGVVAGDNYFVGRAVIPGANGCTMSNIRGYFTQGTQQVDSHFFDLPIGQQYDRIFEELLESVVGDMDADGDVDIRDIDSYRGKIGQNTNNSTEQWDLNNDGRITIDDVQILITEHVETSNGKKGTFLGDLNLDGSVDVLGDAFILVENLNQQVSSYANGDIDFDGVVNVLDDAFVLVSNLDRSNDAGR